MHKNAGMADEFARLYFVPGMNHSAALIRGQALRRVMSEPQFRVVSISLFQGKFSGIVLLKA